MSAFAGMTATERLERRGAEDANRLAKPRHKGEPPSAPDPIEELPPPYSAPHKLLISKGAADGAKILQTVRKLRATFKRCRFFAAYDRAEQEKT